MGRSGRGHWRTGSRLLLHDIPEVREAKQERAGGLRAQDGPSSFTYSLRRVLASCDSVPSNQIFMRKSLEPLRGLDLCLCWEPQRFKWRSYFLALISFPHFGQTGKGKSRTGQLSY